MRYPLSCSQWPNRSDDCCFPPYFCFGAGLNMPVSTAAIHGDVKTFLELLVENYNADGSNWPRVDVLVACPPCQPFSTANRWDSCQAIYNSHCMHCVACLR